MTPVAETNNVVILGRSLFVQRIWQAATADPKEPVLVFLHEALGSVAGWKGFPARLVSSAGLPALVYDRQGHGRSSPFTEPRRKGYHEFEALEILPRLLDFFGISESILIGHSDGGTIALLCAANFPDRVRAVITESAHVCVEELMHRGLVDAKRRYETTDLKRRLAVYHGDKTDSLFRAWIEPWQSEGFRDWNVEHWLPKVKVPVLAIQGAKDEYGTSEQLRRIAQGVKGTVSAVVIPRCGHAPHAHQAEATLRAMGNVIRGVMCETIL